MQSRIRSHLRRHLVAYLALFVALGGTSYAAVRLPPRSVGTEQLKRGAVTNVKVKRGSLTRSVFRRGQLPEARASSAVVRREAIAFQPEAPPLPGDDPNPVLGVGSVSCQAGERATGGGFNVQPPGSSARTSQPILGGDGVTAVGWTVEVQAELDGGPSGSVFVVCASD
jgi:hypothetical protein